MTKMSQMMKMTLMSKMTQIDGYQLKLKTGLASDKS